MTVLLAPINSGRRDQGRTVDMVGVDGIDIGPRHREVREEAVAAIATSMEQIGLRTPICVRCNDDGSKITLLTGAHRLAAAKKLGWETIEAIVYFDGNEIDAELWEIAENLHRAELTKAQRDEHIRRYAELLAAREIQGTQSASPEIGYKKPPPQRMGLASKIATETGLSKDTVRRALNPERVEAERARARAEREAQQAEHDRHQEQTRSALPESIRRAEEAKARNGARDAAVAGGMPEDLDVLKAELEELREENAALKIDLVERDQRLLKYDDMAVQFEKGGFEAVIATKDEQIRILRRQVEDESADKATWANRAAFWKKQAFALGYVSPNSEVEQASRNDTADFEAPF